MKTLKRFYICVLIFQIIIWEAAFAGKVRKGKPGSRRGPGHRNSTLSKSRFKKFTDAYRLFGGQNAQINSMCWGMSSNSYYELQDDAFFLNFSPQCFISQAGIFADSGGPATRSSRSIPPTVDNNHFYRGLCVRPDCDINYHPSEIILNNVNYYDDDDNHNDIAIFKTKKPVIYDNRCGGAPLEPAWISCDKIGPPANYTDCFFASFGPVNEDQESSPEDAPINKVKMTVLGPNECQKASDKGGIPLTPGDFDPTTQICITDSNGLDPVCDDEEDYNPFLFCKYWDQGNSNGWGSHNGWKSENNKGQGSNNNGGGWNSPPKKQNLLAVGHYENYFSDGYCSDDTYGIDLLVKYGAQIYRELFSKCGYYCSSELDKGFRCKGNPPKSLGPVYCYPEKIPANNGWGSTGNGWTP